MPRNSTTARGLHAYDRITMHAQAEGQILTIFCHAMRAASRRQSRRFAESTPILLRDEWPLFNAAFHATATYNTEYIISHTHGHRPGDSISADAGHAARASPRIEARMRNAA